MATPPPPAPGAQVSTYTLTDLLVPANGDVKVAVDSFATKANANDVTIVNTSIDPITILTIEKFGDNDNQQDVIRVDLSEFSDSFTLVLKNTGSTVQDQLYLDGLQTFTDDGDGTFTGTYFGSDGELYTIDIQPEDAAVTPYYALDGLVTGEEGAEIMGVGYTDLQGDEIDGLDGVEDVIIGGGGRDTINAGAGNDTIYGDYEQIGGGSSLGMPPNSYTGTPAGPAAGAEVFAFSITDANLDANGAVVLKVDAITPNKQLAQDFTITDDALTEGLTSIKIEKGGGNDGSADIYRFDLQSFDDDFFIELVDEDAVDRLVFENVHSISVNPDGTYLLTYEGADSAFHEVTVSNDLAQVDFYLSPDSPYFFDDSIDAGAGDDFVDGGFGDDTILGGDGADTLGGGDGSDTIDGGAGDDVIEGDRTGPSQALADTLQYSYAQNSTGDQATHFGEQGTGSADDPLNFIDGDVETEVRYHQDDILEYSFGQEVPAGTSITLIEGPNGVDDGIVNVYVSFGSTDPNGDTLSGSGGGVGYENAITNGEAVLIYSGPSDSTIDLEIPINATHIQFVGIESHGGWAEIEFTELMNPLDAGDDSITGGDGNDLIDAMGGNDTVDGGADNDTILGGAGQDLLLGGTGLDSIDGGDGNDTIEGGAGDDVIDGGTGDDSLLGGDGDDLFVYSGGSDTITDFNAGNTGGLNDGDATNNDSIDLTSHYDSLFEIWADQADDGILNQSNTTDTKGNLVDYSDNTQFAPGDGLTFTGATADNNTFTTENTGVVCFTPGTLILTETGERPIETLRPGDRIVTRDNGVQALQWVACRKLGRMDLEQAPKLRPIWIAPDLIGASAPLLVSPQHGMLLRTDTNDRFLVRATHLERLRGGKARTAKGCRQVTYIHLMFDAHQIIFANGAATESFYPGPMALKALDSPAKDELRALFPELFEKPAEEIYGDRVRTFARFKQLPKRQIELRAA